MFGARFRSWRALCFAALCVTAPACAGSDGVDGAPHGDGVDGAARSDVASARAAILDGTLAPEARSVVGIVNFAGGLCSGSLIAPNLVLTARHCIAASEDDTTAVVCDETMLEVPVSAGAVFVVPLAAVSDDPADFHAVSAIRTPEGATSLCGSDVALLQLATSLTLPPLVPRVDSPLLAGEPYSAVGYGVDGSQSRGTSGVRRQLGGLAVVCVGEECTENSVLPNEWVGPGGACSGDSGGPALDAEGRVIGVLSRGKEGCLSPVYADVFDYTDWLRTAALGAAQAGRYQPAQWACPDCKLEDEELGSSCAFGAPRHSPPTPRLALLLAGAVAVVRRRAHS